MSKNVKFQKDVGYHHANEPNYVTITYKMFVNKVTVGEAEYHANEPKCVTIMYKMRVNKKKSVKNAYRHGNERNYVTIMN